MKKFILVLVSQILLFGCSALSGVYRIPLEVFTSTLQSEIKSDKILLDFDQVKLDIPLNETLWSNVRGAFRDSSDYNNIGFNQLRNFSFIPILPVGVISSYEVSSEIIIPFGKLFTDKLYSAFEPKKVSLNYENIGSKELCEKFQSNIILETKIDSFFVWESPLNNLNMYSVVTVKIYNLNCEQINQTVVRKKMNEYELGSLLSTPGTILENMNIASNNFVQEIVTEIVKYSNEVKLD